MDVNNWIEEVHRNKHNILPVVKMAILKPCKALSDESARSDAFPTDLNSEIAENCKKAEEILKFLSGIGNTSDTSVEAQKKQLDYQVSYVVDVIVPQIEEISGFLSNFVGKEHYFSDNDDGQRAMGLVEKACRRCEMSCEGLRLLAPVAEEKTETTQSVRLSEMLEEVFDDLEHCDVSYLFSNRSLTAQLDEAKFETNVLFNIKENIEKHAFPMEKYVDVIVLDKKVEVSTDSDTEKLYIQISNNGEPFDGNIEKLFNVGYHAGKTGGSGFGLSSAKKYLQVIGGDITYLPKQDYSVSFLITLPK